jgi:hypothetical protein
MYLLAAEVPGAMFCSSVPHSKQLAVRWMIVPEVVSYVITSDPTAGRPRALTGPYNLPESWYCRALDLVQLLSPPPAAPVPAPGSSVSPPSGRSVSTPSSSSRVPALRQLCSLPSSLSLLSGRRSLRSSLLLLRPDSNLPRGGGVRLLRLPALYLLLPSLPWPAPCSGAQRRIQCAAEDMEIHILRSGGYGNPYPPLRTVSSAAHCILRCALYPPLCTVKYRICQVQLDIGYMSGEWYILP